MSNYSRLGLLALSLFVLIEAVPVSPAQSQQPARVWFLRPSAGLDLEVQGAVPTVFANGAPVGTITANGAFYRDFAPGTYDFSVQPYGIPAGKMEQVQLSPGSQTYLQVAWVPTWEEGLAVGDHRDEGCAFFVRNMAPQLARAYLPGMTPNG